MRKLLQLFVPVFMLLFNLHPAFAEKYPYTPTEQEFASLPTYCRLKLKPGNDRTAADKTGNDMFGHDVWIHMHHYCQGLNDINRHYRASDELDRRTFLINAVGEFTYMVGHLPPDSALLAEVYQNRGRVLLMQGNAPDGVADLQKALQLNPKVIQAYFLLADQLEKWKSKDKALQIISDGLRHIPSSKGLQQRYQELGGKLPYPEPLVAKAVEPDTVQLTEPASSSTIQDSSSTPASSVIEQTAVPETNLPKGTPSDRYCRFCAD